MEYSVIFKLLFAVVLIICLWIASKQKSKWGINLKRIYCPVCTTKQAMFRKPDSEQQALWGGTTCPVCHTGLDKYGDIISRKIG